MSRKLSSLLLVTATAAAVLLAPSAALSWPAPYIEIWDGTMGYLLHVLGGTAAAPSVAAEDDPNTGLFWPGGDRLGLTAGGTQRGVLSPSGLALDVPVAGSGADGLQVGGACTTGHTIGTDGLCAAAELEVNGMCYADGGLTLGAALAAGGNDITDLDDIYDSSAQATDAAASPTTVISSAVPYAAPGATNNAGGNLGLIPSSGNNQMGPITRANVSNGTTLTITVIDLTGAVTTTTLTEGDGTGGTWDCAGAASDAAAMCNLYTVALAASAAGKFGVARTDGTCSDELLNIFAVPGTSVWVGVVPSDVDLLTTQGADGQVLLPAASTTWPTIAAAWDTDTGFGISATTATVGASYLMAGGVRVITAAPGSATFNATSVNAGTAYFYSSTVAWDIGAACTPVGIADSSGAACFAGEVYFGDRVGAKIETLADGDATPDVSGANRFLTPANTNPTAITDLDNPVAGQTVTICIGSATNPSTIGDSGNFNLSAAWNPGIDDCIHLLVQADNDYVEIGRSDN